jgi:hypothetical protein
MGASLDYSPIQSLRFAKFSLLLEATENLHLPEYKGSTFRGGFGNALKKALCMTKTFDCPPCLLQQNCQYISIFEPRVNKTVADLLRIGRDAPHPFVLEPPLSEQREFKKGERFIAGLVLIGKAIDLLPSMIYAFSLFGERVGLGTARGKFVLRQVSDSEGSKVYEDRSQQVKDFFRIFTFQQFSDIPHMSPTFALNFVTPTRIMTSYATRSRHLVRVRETNDFWTLIETLYHRLVTLSSLYCGSGILDYSQHRLPLKPTTVSLVDSTIRWQDWERISSRQNTLMKLGGFVGKATFAGKLDEFLPLLRLGEHLHVGKNTSFGLGQYELT